MDSDGYERHGVCDRRATHKGRQPDVAEQEHDGMVVRRSRGDGREATGGERGTVTANGAEQLIMVERAPSASIPANGIGGYA